MERIKTDWKTTSLGVVGGLPSLIEGIAEKNIGKLIQGICTILLGLFAKDSANQF
jgi:hypothetical protein